MGNIGVCRCEGYGFQAVYYINQSVWVQNRVSFFRKLISWLKILSRLAKQLLQDREVLQSLLQLWYRLRGSWVPAAHPHQEIPKVPPRRSPSSWLEFPNGISCFIQFVPVPGPRQENLSRPVSESKWLPSSSCYVSMHGLFLCWPHNGSTFAPYEWPWINW